MWERVKLTDDWKKGNKRGEEEIIKKITKPQQELNGFLDWRWPKGHISTPDDNGAVIT